MATYSIKDSTLTAIGDPIRTLMGLTNQLSPSAMATNLTAANTEVGTQTDLIAQILEAANGKAGLSGFIMGTVTPTDTPAYIAISGKLPNTEQAPLVLFYYETGVSYSDKTHTKTRYILHFAVRSDAGTSVDVKGSYKGAYLKQSSGSSSSSTDSTAYTNTFYTTSSNTSTSTSTGEYPYDVIGGILTDNLIYIRTGALIPGRTYVWGILPWTGG